MKRVTGKVKRHIPRDLYRSCDTLCWRCAKAINNGCSWSERFEPVQGWTAVETGIKMNGIMDKSYLVKDCPEFERG